MSTDPTPLDMEAATNRLRAFVDRVISAFPTSRIGGAAVAVLPDLDFLARRLRTESPAPAPAFQICLGCGEMHAQYETLPAGIDGDADQGCSKCGSVSDFLESPEEAIKELAKERNHYRDAYYSCEGKILDLQRVPAPTSEVREAVDPIVTPEQAEILQMAMGCEHEATVTGAPEGGSIEMECDKCGEELTTVAVDELKALREIAFKAQVSTPPAPLTEGAATRGGLLEPRATGYDRVSAPLPGVGGVTGTPDPGPQLLEVPDVNLVPWEIGEKVITVGGKVVGFTLTTHDGEIIRSWLRSAIREMWELRAQQHEDFPAPQLRARLIQRINENNLLLEHLEAIHTIWLAWRECGAANAILKASEYMAKVGKVVDPTYPTDRLRRAGKVEDGPRPGGGEASPLTWTKDRPTVPGFYWMRHPATMDNEVIELAKDESGSLFQPAEYVDEITTLDEFSPHIQWAGPIPEPTERPAPPVTPGIPGEGERV